MENFHPLLSSTIVRSLTETTFLKQHLCVKFLYQSEQPYWEVTALGAWKALALTEEQVCTLFTERWRAAPESPSSVFHIR